MHCDNNYYSDSSDICEAFASFFESVYSVPISFNHDSFKHIDDNTLNLSNISIGLPELLLELNALDIHKGAGPDDIPPLFLKMTADSLALPLFNIFNESLSCGVFPLVWKNSFLSAIFKNGDRSNIGNYRGIAILSAIPKLFEKLVTCKLLVALKPVINVHQHGFVKGRSTATNLSDFTSYILVEMELGNQIDAVYTDFSKAFDKVDHELLIFKLNKIGIHGNLLYWIQSYLNARTQFVRFSGVLSRAINVTSGVPQGSHLGPLLFVLFINDITLILKNVRFLLYADDLKLFRIVNSLHDGQLLQDNIDLLVMWCKNNGMALNVEKCNTISFIRKKRAYSFEYNIEGQRLVKSEVMKDLGILVDSRLTFKHQIDKVCSKATSMLGFVKRRAKEFNDPYVTKAIYCSLVRSLLEYCSVIWSPYHNVDIMRLESVQKQFLLFALRNLGWNRDTFQLPPYTDRLKLINMSSLVNRRELSEALFAFDLFKGNIDSVFLCSKVSVNINVRNLRYTKFLKEKNHKTNYANHEPFNRCCRSFNKYFHLFNINMSRETYKNNVLAHMMTKASS